MPTQMPSKSESNEPWILNVKPEIRSLPGYIAPPQKDIPVKLNQNENSCDIPEEIKKQVLEAIYHQPWSRYPMYDPPELREKLAEQWGLSPDQILLGNGSNQIIYLLATAILSPNDPVLLSPPTFSLFELVAKIFQAQILSVDQNPDFSLKEEEILKVCAKAKLLFFASPNNPTGRMFSLTFLEALLQKTSGLVVWDEAYGEFAQETAIPLIQNYSNLLILKTFSKLGLAGLRIGYLIGNSKLIGELKKANIPYNINRFTLSAILKFLENTEWMKTQVQRIIQEREKMVQALYTVPHITPYPSSANFILFRTPDGNKVFEELKQRGVLVRTVDSHPLLHNCLRVTVGTAEENQIFIETLRGIMEKIAS